MKRALVLSGGGARGAFQVGMLQELVVERGLDFQVIRGVSVGALNAAFLAQASTSGDSHGELVAKVQDPILASCYTPEGHEAFCRTARSAAAEAVRGASTARARRRAERRAIYATLEKNDFIRRARGGVPLGRVET